MCCINIGDCAIAKASLLHHTTTGHKKHSSNNQQPQDLHRSSSYNPRPYLRYVSHFPFRPRHWRDSHSDCKTTRKEDGYVPNNKSSPFLVDDSNFNFLSPVPALGYCFSFFKVGQKGENGFCVRFFVYVCVFAHCF